MGADIKALRVRIKSVDSTLHLTKAMGLVASSKMRRANEGMRRGREYKASLDSFIGALCASAECQKSAYMQLRGDDISRTRIIVIAGDRGLAGGYNANVFRLSAQYNGAQFIPIGKRSCDRYRTAQNSSEHYTSESAYKLARTLCEDFAKGEYDRLGIIFTKYVSMMTQTAEIKWILPLERGESASSTGMIFEPDERSVLDAAIPEYVSGMLMCAIRESFASEIAARRMAMDSAGKNATAMIDDLQLKYNRARQGAITQEITEIVAGAGE